MFFALDESYKRKIIRKKGTCLDNPLRAFTGILVFSENFLLILKLNYNIPRACLLNRSPVPAMDLKSNRSGL